MRIAKMGKPVKPKFPYTTVCDTCRTEIEGIQEEDMVPRMVFHYEWYEIRATVKCPNCKRFTVIPLETFQLEAWEAEYKKRNSLAERIKRTTARIHK